jgi:nucleotide-binding universal stress UspA family protein
MRVFAASDFSEGSDEALRQAHTLARATSGKLAVCHVITQPVMHAFFPQEYERDLERIVGAVPEVSTALGQRVQSLAGPDADVDIIVAPAQQPYAEIVRQAEAWKADRIVLGGVGRTALERMLLGSVAERVARYAHCPVQVARKSPPGAVLVGTDLSESSLGALEAGVAEARWRERQLIVLYASELMAEYVSSAGAMFGLTPPAPPHELIEQRHIAARRLLQDSLARVAAAGEIVVVEEPAAQALIRRAETLPAELVVVGTHGRTGLPRVVLGSIAERVLHGSHCSVLVVRG